MAKKPVQQSRAKQFFYNRMILEWIIIILLLIIIWLLLAMGFKMWPWNEDSVALGSAFTSQSVKDNSSEADNGSSNGSNGSGTSDNNAGSSGGTGGTGNTGNNGNNGGTSGGDSGNNGGSNGGSANTETSPILRLAANLNRGNSKDEVVASANGLNGKCTIVADTTIAGKQEVCVYTEGSKIVTVTLLNDRVLSASRSGF